MTVQDWARSVKPDLQRLQAERGIPALWAAAQMAHESAAGGGRELSRLAREHHNYAGLKWAAWQRQYGCRPVNMNTWEVVDGQRVDLSDAFCSCPSWEVWLQVYAGLLTGDHYRPALSYAGDPLLYGAHIRQLGWATDPAYVDKVAGWMGRLWPDYADTLPGGTGDPAGDSVTVELPNGQQVLGVVRDGTTWTRITGVWMPIRGVAEALGCTVTWVPPEEGGPRVRVQSHR